MSRPFHPDSTNVKIVTTALVVAGLIGADAKRALANNEAAKASQPKHTTASQSGADFLNQELKTVAIDFGVSANNIPQDFVDKVHRWARLYQTRDRDEMDRVLRTMRKEFETVLRQVADASLLPDLAFVTLVESHFQARVISSTDNAGLWQFTRDTARRNGLKVNANVDERLDPH
ncbi:MAG: transglycosylase SLT domain-containing protein, partial [Pyrinomonadaceae bacterium]